jgi:hypothetical protein
LALADGIPTANSELKSRIGHPVRQLARKGHGFRNNFIRQRPSGPLETAMRQRGGLAAGWVIGLPFMRLNEFRKAD